MALATADDASATGPLRGATVGLLTRFREALRDEMADPGSKLPADYEVRLFAYLDKLSADRTAAAARRGSSGNSASPEAETPVIGGEAGSAEAPSPTSPGNPVIA